MAKIAFSKFGAKVDASIKTIDIKEQVIEVRQYLPVNDKLQLIGNVIEYAHDIERNFANPLKSEVYFAIEVIRAYTNITFTEKQLEEPQKLYDALESNGIIDAIFDAIPEKEMIVLRENLAETSYAFYTYRNSVFGIIDNISQDYTDTEFNITELQKKIASPEALDLLKKLSARLG